MPTGNSIQLLDSALEREHLLPAADHDALPDDDMEDGGETCPTLTATGLEHHVSNLEEERLLLAADYIAFPDEVMEEQGGETSPASSATGLEHHSPEPEKQRLQLAPDYIAFPDEVMEDRDGELSPQPTAISFPGSQRARLRRIRTRIPELQKKIKEERIKYLAAKKWKLPGMQDLADRMYRWNNKVAKASSVDLPSNGKPAKPKSVFKVAKRSRPSAIVVKPGAPPVARSVAPRRIQPDRKAKHQKPESPVKPIIEPPQGFAKGLRNRFARSVWERTIPELRDSLVFWVDGSFVESTKLGGAAVVLSRGDAPLTLEAFAIKGFASSMEVELYAIEVAFEAAIFETQSVSSARIIIFSDCQGAIALAANFLKPQKHTARVRQSRMKIARDRKSLYDRGCTVEVLWVPGHKGVPGNMCADRVAVCARHCATQITPVSGVDVQIQQVALAELMRNAANCGEHGQEQLLDLSHFVLPTSGDAAGNTEDEPEAMALSEMY